MKHLRLLTNVLALAFLMPFIACAQDPSLAWAKRMGGNLQDWGSSIAIDASGNVYIAGLFEGTVDFDPGPGVDTLTSAGGKDIFISKLNEEGELLWARRMGGAGAYGDWKPSISIDLWSNIYITARISGHIFIGKLNGEGELIWEKKICCGLGSSIATDKWGNIYTTGFFSGTVDFDPGPGVDTLTSVGNDIFVSKLNAEGELLWAKRMGGVYPDNILPGDGGYSIATDKLGNVFITGWFSGTVDFDPGPEVDTLTSTGKFDAFVSKLNVDGNYIWSKQLGGTGYDWGRSIATNKWGDVYTTGFFSGTVNFNPGSGVDILNSANGLFISKFDSAGNFIRVIQMGGPAEPGDIWNVINLIDEEGLSIAIDTSDNVFITGWFEETMDFDPGPLTDSLTPSGGAVFISKLNADDELLWATNMGGSLAASITTDEGGNVYTTGFFGGTADFDPGQGVDTLTSAGSYDIFIVKLSQTTINVTSPQFWDTFSIYPNPASDYFTLHLEGEPRQDILVELFSSTGQTIFREALDFQSGTLLKNYSCRDIPAGMYLVRVSDVQGSVFRKIIIE